MDYKEKLKEKGEEYDVALRTADQILTELAELAEAVCEQDGKEATSAIIPTVLLCVMSDVTTSANKKAQINRIQRALEKSTGKVSETLVDA